MAPKTPMSALVEGADMVVFGVLSALARVLGPAFAFAIALLALRACLLAVLAPLQARRSRRRGFKPYRGGRHGLGPGLKGKTGPPPAARTRPGQRTPGFTEGAASTV